MKEIVVVLHDIRSTHNVGSILRTCDGFGVKKVIFSGYTPYPSINNDSRLPHIKERLTSQIKKTSLGAEVSLSKIISQNLIKTIEYYKNNGFIVACLEQNKKSVNIVNYLCPNKLLLILGNELTGVDNNIINLCDQVLEIKMYGKKESFNVSVASAIALFALRES